MENEEFREENKEEIKESNGVRVIKKALVCVFLGLVFGVFAAVGFLAVQKTTGLVIKKDSAMIQESAPEKEDKVENQNTPTNNAPQGQNSGEVHQATVITGETDVAKVAEMAMPFMVSIVKDYEYDGGFYYFGSGITQDAQASGSGIIIAETDTEYLIVSNNHVVENPKSLEITFADDTTASAYIKGTDPEMDVAVVAVLKEDVSEATRKSILVANLGDSTRIKLGEPVVAIGNALGYGQSVTAGIISAINRELESEDGTVNKFIQTDAAINPGNSGGALLNMAGELIGINSNKIGGSVVEGMGYAIPISAVTDIIKELMEHQTRIPVADGDIGYVGIEYREVTSSLSKNFGIPVGIYIVNTVPGGAAQEAGLESGDVITKFAGDKVAADGDLQRILKYYAAGSTVDVVFMRQENGEYVEHEIKLTLGSRPSSSK